MTITFTEPDEGQPYGGFRIEPETDSDNALLRWFSRGGEDHAVCAGVGCSLDNGREFNGKWRARVHFRFEKRYEPATKVITRAIEAKMK